MEVKTGVITDIIFYNEDNGYTIAEMETDDELLVIVGTLPSAVVGTCLELTGTFKVHPKYGEQFAFTEAIERLPETEMGIEGFLASGVIKGVGPKLATTLVSYFGTETLEIIGEEPERLTEIPGIGQKKMETIAASFREHREFANVSIEFQKFGVSAAQALRLYQRYGSNALSLVLENPYRLVKELYGFGFRKADEIAMSVGIPKESPFRIDSGIQYALEYGSGDGSTYTPKEELIEMVSQTLDITREEVEERVIALAFDGSIKVDKVCDEEVVYGIALYMAEQKVCANLQRLQQATLKSLTVNIDRSIDLTENASGIALSDKQKSAVRSSLTQGVSVITGGPGTGKTTIINTLINIFLESDFRVAIAAPTGRAAKRITETSGNYAQTVHRLLEYFFEDASGEMTFGKTSEEPLEYDVVIVDEASMIDLMLMKGLTDAIAPGTRLILVGDSDQLPSVGAGNVLTDLISSGFVPVARLTEIYRQAQESMIVVNAHRINHGEYPTFNGRNTDFFFMERTSERDTQDLIVELITQRLPRYYKSVEAASGIQVLTPTKKGTLGTKELNARLQEALNPPRDGVLEKAHQGRIFREGDKVMQIRNNYQMEWKVAGEENTNRGVFNGDVGFIKAISLQQGTMTVVYDEERFVQYEFSQLDELELAYAITVHKSQGSEFPIVVMPISWFPPMLATRNLLYTAVTRGKQVVVLVGSTRQMRAMVDNDRIRLRYSGLGYRLERLLEFADESQWLESVDGGR